VDGIRLEKGLHQNPDEANTRTTIFDDLDPNSIERIEVIKGAAATTLYGTEAAAGVIQIFTKGGGGGAPQWTATINQGFSSIGHVGPKMDKTGLGVNDCTDWPGCPKSGSWLRKGHLQEYELSVQGGSSVPWYISGTFADQEGNIAPQGGVNMSLRANFRFEPLENLSIRASNMFTRRDITFVPNGNNAEGILLNVMRGPRDYTPNDVGDAAVLDMGLRQQIDHFLTGLNLTWTPTANLSNRLNVGMDYSTSEYTEERPWGFYSKNDGDRENDLALDRNITVDYAGTWSTDLPLVNLASTTSWGAQYYDEFSWGLNGYGETFAGPGDKLITSAVETDVWGEGWLRVASGGFFLQEQFGWQDRLFVTVGARWDGFSTFGENFGLAFYPKFSAAYTISDHTFWPEWWDTMKLRMALGESGRAPSPFASKRTWASVSGDTRQPGVILAELGNEDVGPERTRELEFGFEGSIFDGRFSMDFTYFDQSTTDALLRLDRPSSIGTEQAILTNLGEVVNSGFEFTANASLYSGSRFSWDLGGNFYTGENEIVSLGPVTDERLKGRPVGAQFGDIAQNPDEMGVRPDWEEEYLGPPRPTMTWGVNTRMTFFRRLTLESLGEFQGGHIREAGAVRQNIRREQWLPCQPIFDAVNAGDYSMYTAGELAKCSHRDASYGEWTTKGDFFRLRSVSLSYRLPENWLPTGTTGMTVRLQGRNLWHTTDYPGFDPEGNAYGVGAGWSWSTREYYNLPVPRVFMLSVTTNF
jgi:TonB-dependent SusC/RagA subfamily outer membrane receptor